MNLWRKRVDAIEGFKDKLQMYWGLMANVDQQKYGEWDLILDFFD